MAERDWLAWHEPYDDPSSSLSRRLDVVQRHLATALDRCPEGTISIVSMCAGQGRDILGVLERHPPSIRDWFANAGFHEDAFEAPAGTSFGVGLHRLHREPAAFAPGLCLFSFVGDESLQRRSD